VYEAKTEFIYHTEQSVPDTANAFPASSMLQQGQSYSLVFNTTGTYTYYCAIHPQMKATIIVTG
jgi:plastocyanin